METKHIIENVHTANRFRGAEICKLLKNNESIEDLLRLLVSRDGIDFATQTKYPSMDVFRQSEDWKRIAEKFGVIVDKGCKLRNIPFLFLVGKGHSEITYDDNQIAYRIVLMHGHKATITAKNGALVMLHHTDDCKPKITEENIGKVIKL